MWETDRVLSSFSTAADSRGVGGCNAGERVGVKYMHVAGAHRDCRPSARGTPPRGGKPECTQWAQRATSTLFLGLRAGMNHGLRLAMPDADGGRRAACRPAIVSYAHDAGRRASSPRRSAHGRQRAALPPTTRQAETRAARRAHGRRADVRRACECRRAGARSCATVPSLPPSSAANVEMGAAFLGHGRDYLNSAEASPACHRGGVARWRFHTLNAAASRRGSLIAARRRNPRCARARASSMLRPALISLADARRTQRRTTARPRARGPRERCPPRRA